MDEKSKTKSKEANKTLEGRKDRIKRKFSKWFSDPYNKGFFWILILAAVLRIIVFQITKNQGLWWDEAGYLAYAKQVAFGWDWTIMWNPHKPVLFSWLMAPIYKFGIGEIGVRIFILLMSIAAVWLVYLTAKEFFDKKIALFSSFLMSVFWVHLFFTGRLLVELPSTTLFLASLYFFARGYIKKENPKFIWWFGISFALAFLMRVSYGILIIPFILYFFMEEKMKVFKNKNLWITLLLIVLIISPMIIWLFANYQENPIGTFLGIGKNVAPELGRLTTGMHVKGIWPSFADLLYVLQPILLIIFIIGALLYFADILLGFDLIFKKDNPEIRKRLFILILILIQLIAFGWFRAYIEQRDKMPIIIFLFAIAGFGLFKIRDYIAKEKQNILKFLNIIILLLVLFIGYGQMHFVLNSGESGTMSVKTSASSSYNLLKEIGLWMNGYSAKGAVIISAALPEMQYYTEREVHPFDAWDYGVPKTENESKADMQSIKTEFIEVHDPNSIPEIAPGWAFSYIPENNETFIPVMAWFSDAAKTKAVAVIYQVQH